MPTIDANSESGAEDSSPQLRTAQSGDWTFDERFRRNSIRGAMFGGGDDGVALGRYRVQSRIGAGAMGAVYLAVDDSLDRKVAIKVLRREDEIHRQRMQREAKALAKLSHPNVVTVHEVGDEQGQLFVAMEYIPGQTLREWLAGERSLPEIVTMFEQAAAGLQAAHDAGVVHRDFKPENVIVGEDGRVRVLDFGLAHTPGEPLVDAVAQAEAVAPLDRPTLTRTGVLAGTPAYMSPEQFLGTTVDPRADQFAFCVALREAVWGERPFVGETMAELATAVIDGEPALEAGGAKGDREQLAKMEQTIRRGLSREPTDRFESMHALVQSLRVQPRSGPMRALVMSAVFAFATLALAGVGAGLLVLRGPDDSATQSAVAVAPAAAGPCADGTFRDGDRCSPLPWTPDLVSCTDSGCRVPRWVVIRSAEDTEFRRHFGRIVPATRDGAVVGYKVYGVVDGNFPAAVGLVAGDLIRKVNGLSLSGADVDLMQTLSEPLKRAFESSEDTVVLLEVERKGQDGATSIVPVVVTLFGPGRPVVPPNP